MSFQATVNNHPVIMDADESVGGENGGPRPKALLLAGLAGCTGMDVVSILKKMQVTFDDLKISVEADLSEEHPKVFEKIHIIYHFTGTDLVLSKLEKAVSLSQDKYCGVSAMFSKVASLTYSIVT